MDLKAALEEIIDKLESIQSDVEDIPGTAVEDVEGLIRGSSGGVHTLHPINGIDNDLQDVIDKLYALSKEEN